MAVYRVALRTKAGNTSACLRELCGHDEMEVLVTDSLTAVHLVDRLLSDAAGSGIRKGNARVLPIAERDRVLAEIYIRTFGSKIDSVVNCRKCRQLFDIGFDLRSLLDHVWQKYNSSKQNQDGFFKVQDGLEFRLPTGEDETAVMGMKPEEAVAELLTRCVKNNGQTVDLETVQRAMEDTGPLLDLDLDARCPECGEHQQVRFDIQYFLLSSLKEGQKLLVREVDRLARTYGWSLNEILSLPHDLRVTYADMADSGPSINRKERR